VPNIDLNLVSSVTSIFVIRPTLLLVMHYFRISSYRRYTDSSSNCFYFIFIAINAPTLSNLITTVTVDPCFVHFAFKVIKDQSFIDSSFVAVIVNLCSAIGSSVAIIRGPLVRLAFDFAGKVTNSSFAAGSRINFMAITFALQGP